MPGRITPLVNDQIYHVFNRGIDHRPTFTEGVNVFHLPGEILREA